MLVYVDDLLLLSEQKAWIHYVYKKLSQIFTIGEHALHIDDVEIDSLNIQIKREEGKIIAYQQKYVEKLVQDSEITGESKVPNTKDLFEEIDTP